ncbi:probable 2-oxoglutarate-dependent dioxygenase AOP1.2 [Hibiscus syriacus]|uniref:probable 2-oxoglutarate-dependent dioxygenase AOP1.2 n=1 Tax=Hibiscus syriacus TaxID=106335 RepID=UPI0019231378|nr:probable 2-oxoglutarate-dependent dioxygenase AOP1.2 [Hibiscus syriacus]
MDHLTKQETSSVQRLMLNTWSPPSGVYKKAFHSHTDKSVSTIICDDLVSGLEIELNDGQWVKLSSTPGSFFFVVGDPLMAWSNGRIKAVNDRVMMSGNKDRFSMACFAVPAEGTIISTPKEFVDEQHPQLFKDFDFKEFIILFAFSEQASHIESTKQIHAFASLSPPVSN